MRHTITVTTNQGQEHQVVWDDISGEVFGDLAEQLREVMARSTATGYVSGYGFPAICKDPYHDPDDFVAVLDLFGTVTLPYELRGAKVMQTENDYDKEVFNGDIGFVATIDTDATEMVIDFDGREVTYSFRELDEIALCYATAIHKSQGSEYPAVVIPIMAPHYMMLERNLLYTGITRGKRLVVLVGQKKAIGMAVRGVKDRRRWSKLRERLTQR